MSCDHKWELVADGRLPDRCRLCGEAKYVTSDGKPIQSKARRCDTCEAWGSEDKKTMRGECRAKPPIALPAQDYYQAYWPDTKADDWCMEHVEKQL